MHPEIITILNKEWKSIDVTFDNIETKKLDIPTKAGLYKVITTTPISILKELGEQKDRDSKHYNIKSKIKSTSKIPDSMLIRQKDEKAFYCVYNGESYKLRQRFVEHFRGVKGNAGLAIFEIENLKKYEWKFEFIELKENQDSKVYRTLLEQNLRAKDGWPILCDQ